MNWLKKTGGIAVALLIFTGTLYFLLSTFVKKPENSQALRKEYTFIDLGDTSIYEQFYVSPHAKVRIKLLRGDEIVYDQLYEYDEHMFRIPRKTNPEAKKHVIFAGCSFTWGEGVKSEETFGSFFQDQAKEVQSYNHSFPGGGLHSLLRYHDYIKLKDAIKEEEGVMFYTFIPTHMERFFARYNFLSMAPAFAPSYSIKNGTVVYNGFMKDQEFYKVFQEAKKKNLGDTLINTQDPLKWDPKEFSDYMVAIERLKELYLENFPKGKFIFLFHPIGNPPTMREEMKVYLKAKKIEFIDLAHEYGLELHKNKLEYAQMVIPEDGHPNARSNELSARALHAYLKKVGQSLK